MSLARRLRTMFCCAFLQLGALIGIPMRPEQVQDLMQALNKAKTAHSNPEKRSVGEGPEAGKSSGH